MPGHVYVGLADFLVCINIGCGYGLRFTCLGVCVNVFGNLDIPCHSTGEFCIGWSIRLLLQVFEVGPDNKFIGVVVFLCCVDSSCGASMNFPGCIPTVSASVGSSKCVDFVTLVLGWREVFLHVADNLLLLFLRCFLSLFFLFRRLCCTCLEISFASK